jgi:hypothetical protein
MTSSPAPRQHVTLTVTSLLTVSLFSVHVSQDIVHDPNVDKTGTAIILGILLLYLYGTLELAGRRAGYVIMLLGGIAAAYMPFLHTLGPRAARWGFEFVWPMVLMGATGTLGAVVSARELWRSLRRPQVSGQVVG